MQVVFMPTDGHARSDVMMDAATIDSVPGSAVRGIVELPFTGAI